MSEIFVHVGIDLGSTTTKAIVLTEAGAIIGRGITNSRSNYDVACEIAREEAFIQARLALLRQALESNPAMSHLQKGFLSDLVRNFRMEQHLERLDVLARVLREEAETPRHREHKKELDAVLEKILDALRERAVAHFGPLATRKSDFFRDLAAADYMNLAEQLGDPRTIPFDTLCALFDAAILVVENTSGANAFAQHIGDALERTLATSGKALKEYGAEVRRAVEAARVTELVVAGTVGTGYGRQRLPFPKEQIRSEILCHGLGAHAMFPSTRTVLDIGGQDTKAIQVDSQGIVTSFQMNDRCAAGCGRYLGYIADEMNLGLHELGPLAQQSSSRVKINSTCTVFAGAELRERLSLGQNREDILAGLHRAIILRAMSLLARSGGVSDEFTFTGGVARNPAAVAALEELIRENYGQRRINISAESIYTGALGAALFARRAERRAA
ncbi:MAG TPA: BadF/BadG/BcrA/BcrD ATPase family protein [Candidatus Acidoferrales bacterium]|nr:BadF/BadG/BcrA/BcrD ATPase family protein [Candidatus Acidoferrales bacterium]